MPVPHTIRLRHPWEEVDAGAGRRGFRRKFNRPTGLDAWESVLLEIDRVLYRGEVKLNGTSLGSLELGELFTVDITPLLMAANELVVDVDPATRAPEFPPSASIYIVDPNEPPGSPIGEVRLIIRTVSSTGND